MTPPADDVAQRRAAARAYAVVAVLSGLVLVGLWSAADDDTTTRRVVVASQRVEQFAQVETTSVATAERRVTAGDTDVLTDVGDVDGKLALVELPRDTVVRPSQLVDGAAVAERHLVDVTAPRSSREPAPGEVADVLLSATDPQGRPEDAAGAVVSGVPVLAVADVDGQRRYTLAVTEEERRTVVRLLGSSTVQVIAPAPLGPSAD